VYVGLFLVGPVKKSMRSQCFSSTLIGVEAHLVGVEVVISSGLPGLTVVGLPDTAVTEAGARVRSALKLTGVNLPPRRMVVNLSPADLRKSGAGFDLALALGLLEALGEIPAGCLAHTLVVGELSLGGEVRRVRGVVSYLALAASTTALRRIVVPFEQVAGLPRWDGVDVVGVSTLEQAIQYCRGEWIPVAAGVVPTQGPSRGTDLAEVRGQDLAKLALEIAAAGGHHLAMVGPPGCGKSLLASCLPGLLPPLTDAEEREVAVISSVCEEEQLLLQRPFRSPGSVISPSALLGSFRPGEVTRAHRGVLFLDEFPEFRRDALESLRLVLEEGQVRVSRARFQTTYPAHFTLICAMNPCPCGMASVPGEVCQCSSRQVARYRGKLSGPLLDRLDLLVGLHRVPLSELHDRPVSESSQCVAQRVGQAREIQMLRGCLNRDLSGDPLFSYLNWSRADQKFALEVGDSTRLSMRAFQKWLRVARTLADLEGTDGVSKQHLLVARSLRVTLGSGEQAA
jgi:magnesium chelatase family protein